MKSINVEIKARASGGRYGTRKLRRQGNDYAKLLGTMAGDLVSGSYELGIRG
jgi:hypothetical protein